MKSIPLRETPYCTACAARLRSWDFFAGRAVFVGPLPYCAPCVPSPPREIRGARRLPTHWNLL